MALRDIFRPSYKREWDQHEATHYFRLYGDKAIERLESRVSNIALGERDRRHWARILKQVKALASSSSAQND